MLQCSASKLAQQLRWVPQVWKIQLLGCATNIPGDETEGFNSVLKVLLASLLHGRRFPSG